MNCSLPGFSVHGILLARTLEWVAIPFSRGSSQLRDRAQIFCIAGRVFYPSELPGELKILHAAGQLSPYIATRESD